MNIGYYDVHSKLTISKRRNKMAREYYTIDQWGYSIKPEALTVYARELLNVPVDL